MAQVMLREEDVYRGALILVTPSFPLRRFQEASGLRSVFGRSGILLKKQAAEALGALLTDIRCTDEITAVSGYRTREKQEEIWEGSLAEHGEEFTRKFVAVPGHSEHQTGYAVDLAENAQEIDFICPEFPRTGIFRRFRERMADFGFIERYAAGKESITGIGAEPWHFRYVGYPHSVLMNKNGIAMEEYIGFLRENTEWGHPYTFRDQENQIEVSYIRVEDTDPLALDIPDGYLYGSSGTNEGGVVVSLWRERYGR